MADKTGWKQQHNGADSGNYIAPTPLRQPSPGSVASNEYKSSLRGEVRCLLEVLERIRRDG